jgi:hypothetical protein
MKKGSFLLCGVFSLIAASFAFAQQLEPKFDFYTRGPYRESVPRPQSILRFDVGDHHTTYAQMEQVIFAIAKAAPDRVKIREIGTTNEHRMQYVLAISSPENIARLDEIKANTALLADPRRTSRAEAERIAATTPSTAWMGYTIHGNESSSFEAFMQVVYQLAASDEPETLEILRNNVVLVLTGANPDGHERFATWYNSVAVGSPDRRAYEHTEPWSIYGRHNHYRFNLNRDTLAMTQKETHNMIKAYNEWNPQVAVDHHGQTSQYFFPPAALPINPNLPQPVTNRWMDIYGRANASAFDANRWDYYVRDVFDAFYPGYWDTYPSLSGAIGMTYETDGGGWKGLNWERDDGTIVTFRSSIAKHYVASMTTLQANSRNKTERLRDFYDFRAKALSDHAAAKLKRVVIVPGRDPVKSAELVEVLLRSNVEVKLANSAFSSLTAHSYLQKDAPAERRNFPAGSYVVDLDQPQRILIKSILEQDTPQDKAFVEENMARFRRNQMRGQGQPKEEYGFYDVTAWSLPLSFGVEAYWTEDSGSLDAATVTQQSIEQAKLGGTTGRASVAYIIPYQTDATGPMVMRLTQQGFKVAVATRSLNAGGRNYPAGTFVVRVSRNPETLHEAISRMSREMGVRVTAVDSGYADEGDTGIGGEAVLSLSQPKIAVLADEGTDAESYGSIWWTLDKYGIKFTPLSASAIRSGALRDYNVLILPNGNPGRYNGNFNANAVNTLKQWVSEGGNLVAIRGAAVFAALKDVDLTSSRMVGSEETKEAAKPAASPSPSPSPEPTPPSDKADQIPAVLPPIASPSADANKVPVPLPGSIMRATVDRTTYLNYGVNESELPVLLASGYFFGYSKQGTNALVFDESPRRPLTVSGFTWQGNTEELLRGTSYLIDESRGGGHVILFAEDPFYRGMTRAVTRQFFNSMAFVGVF